MTPHSFGSREWYQNIKDSNANRYSTVGDNGLFEGTVGDLKQGKERCEVHD